MKKLLFAVGFLIFCTGCEPGKLKTEKGKVDTGPPPIPVEELEPIGMIPADDCQQVDIGDKACNFRLTDQAGKTWDLYQHTGDVIVLDISAYWCYPCQLAADYAQPLQDEFASEGVQVVTILIDGPNPGEEPTESDIQRWVSLHNITTSPVLQGSREKMLDATGVGGYSIGGFPTYLYIGRDMKFYAGHVGFSEEFVREKIQEGL